MQHQNSRKGIRRSGFTLVEIVVVLTIAALLSSILFTSFKSVSEGNKKSSCQNNLVQIYQGLRQYGQDNDGNFPAYNPLVPDRSSGVVQGRVANDEAGAGLGLWALYAYPATRIDATKKNLDCDGRTTTLPGTELDNGNSTLLASYIKSPRFFHCPYDDVKRDTIVADTQCNVTAGTRLLSSVLKYNDQNGVSRFNPFYNSYQTADDVATDALSNATYSSFRQADGRRQLVYFQSVAAPSLINRQQRTPDTTIVTWCRFHRRTDSTGATVPRADNSDNVLFMDGTVRYLPTTQKIGTADCTGWQRIPEETVEGYNAANPNTCAQ